MYKMSNIYRRFKLTVGNTNYVTGFVETYCEIDVNLNNTTVAKELIAFGEGTVEMYNQQFYQTKKGLKDIRVELQDNTEALGLPYTEYNLMDLYRALITKVKPTLTPRALQAWVNGDLTPYPDELLSNISRAIMVELNKR